MSYQNVRDSLGHVPQFGGDVYYVSTAGHDTNNDGLSPSAPFLTIGAAITATAVGDTISILPGTYTEISLDLDTDGVKIIASNGVILTPATGTALVVSGNNCSICSDVGSMVFNPAAGQTGIQITGDYCDIADVRIACASSANIGIEVTAAATGTVLHNVRPSSPMEAAFKISGDKTKIHDSNTGSVPANTSIGYWITGSCDKCRIFDCSSQGHGTASIQVDAGCTNGSIFNFSSGGEDGRWSDADSAFVWSNFTYADLVYKTTEFAGVATTYNIFKFTGAVRITGITGDVTTVIPNTASTIHLELWADPTAVDITDSPGVDIDSAVVGATLIRNAPLASVLALGNPATVPVAIENASYRNPETSIDIVADNVTTTYVRLVLSAALASGAIHWHCTWEPLNDKGFLEPA